MSDSDGEKEKKFQELIPSRRSLGKIVPPSELEIQMTDYLRRQPEINGDDAIVVRIMRKLDGHALAKGLEPNIQVGLRELELGIEEPRIREISETVASMIQRFVGSNPRTNQRTIIQKKHSVDVQWPRIDAYVNSQPEFEGNGRPAECIKDAMVLARIDGSGFQDGNGLEMLIQKRLNELGLKNISETRIVQISMDVAKMLREDIEKSRGKQIAPPGPKLIGP